jgi:thioredoxin-like negative regulator of GroEL
VLEVRALPTFVLLRDGAEVCRLEGAPQRRPARALAQALRAHLGEAAAAGGGRRAASGGRQNESSQT